MPPKSNNKTHNGENRLSGKPFVGVIFKCCRIYSRIYLNKKGDAFVGWCPRCSKKMTMRVSPTGSKERFFTAE